MSNIRLTADLHLGRRSVSRARGASSVQEQDAAVAHAWDRCVEEDDMVIILGDLSDYDVNQTAAWLAERPGQIIWLRGNNDGHLSDLTALGYTEIGSDNSSWSAISELYGPRALTYRLSHYPYGHPKAPEDLGNILLHGHVHSSAELRVTRSSSGTPQVNVGWDSWHMLPTLADVRQALADFC